MGAMPEPIRIGKRIVRFRREDVEAFLTGRQKH